MADGCVHITESVGSRRELVANSCTHRRRRRDATRQFRRVGVGGVYWALEGAKTTDCIDKFVRKLSFDLAVYSIFTFHRQRRVVLARHDIYTKYL